MWFWRVAHRQWPKMRRIQKTKTSESCKVSGEHRISHPMRVKHAKERHWAANCKDRRVEWHHTSSDPSSRLFKHQVHARIFKWIYVRNKQTPHQTTKPEHHVLVSHTFFFSLNYCIEVTMLFVRRSNECVCVLHVTVTASMLHFKSKIYDHSSIESMLLTLHTDCR